MIRRLSVLVLAAALAAALVGCSSRSGGALDSSRDRAPAEPVESRDSEFGTRPGDAGQAGRFGRDPLAEEDARRRTAAAEVEERLEDVFFAFDQSTLSWEARQSLARNATVLRERPAVDVILEGHCDERGTSEYNLALGERRARSVHDYLVQAGISPARMTIVSYGEERPFALGHDERAWALNRRVHFRVR